MSIQYKQNWLFEFKIPKEVAYLMSNFAFGFSCCLCILNISIGFAVGNSATGAIAGGVAAGAALLFAAPAILLAWWRRRKPQDHFFDVPG